MRRALPFLVATGLTLAPAHRVQSQTAPASAVASVEQLITTRRLDAAKTAIDAMLARDRNDAGALYLMGRYAYAQGNSSQAVDWLEKAVARNDRVAIYHLWLGNALGDEAQKASKFRQPFFARRVKSEFERTVQLDPRSVDGRLGLVDFYSVAPGIMGGDMNKAKAQAAELMPLNAMRGHFALSRVAEREKDTVTAERELRAAVAAQPDSSFGYAGLAAFLRRHGRWDDAFATWDALIRARPDLATAHANWGIYAAMSGKNLERGERELKYYLEHTPADAPPTTISLVHAQLGQLYEKTSRKELARAEYTEALKINPKNDAAKKALDALR